MTKREISVRILNILMVISFLVIYIKDKFWVDAGFYICTLYILYLVLKPFMLRQPLNTPFNYMFEFFDVLFVVAISALVTQNAFLPLAFFAILRCALMFPVYFVLLSYVVASISVAFFITSAVDISSVHELALTLLMMIIPPVVVCFVKNDVVKIDSVNRDLSEQLKIKAAVIDELQKYNDVQFSGDHKSESKILRTDFVTQIPNRFAFEEMLKKGVTKSHEPSFNMGLMMIYIDGLYQYRVKYSYSTEHILVKRIYDIVREQMKTNDFIARYEEDILSVLLFNKDIAHAENIARIIYSNFDAMKFNEPELESIELKIAINDIENAMDSDGTQVDTLKFLNKCKYVDFYNDSIRR